MSLTHPRLRRERKTIESMFVIYCRDQHASPSGELCGECQALRDYALQRLERCPFPGKQADLRQLRGALL
jgi:hypothetical protein